MVEIYFVSAMLNYALFLSFSIVLNLNFSLFFVWDIDWQSAFTKLLKQLNTCLSSGKEQAEKICQFLYFMMLFKLVI